jgi:plastocyanin
MRQVARYLAISAMSFNLALPAPPFLQDGPTVSVQDELFDPAQAAILAGDTLTWSQDGAEQHTITADDGVTFDSGVVNPGDVFAFTFDTPGTYPYYCQIHGAPGGVGMAGIIFVD